MDEQQHDRDASENQGVPDIEKGIAKPSVSVTAAGTSRTPPKTQASQRSDKVDFLERAVHDAGLYSEEIVSVDVWVLSPGKSHLFRPDGAFWLDPVWHDRVHGETSNCALCRLTDPTVPGYVKPPTLAAGVGLPGILWAEAEPARDRRFAEGNPEPDQTSMLQGAVPDPDPTKVLDESRKRERRRIRWRDIQAINNNPDQQSTPRLRLLAEAPFRYAGGIPFHNMGKKGIVIFKTRRDVNDKRLRSQKNEAYMYGATDLIGSAYALQQRRTAAIDERNERVNNNFRRARSKIKNLIDMGVPLDANDEKQSNAHVAYSDEEPQEEESDDENACLAALSSKAKSLPTNFTTKVKVTWHKLRGSDGEPLRPFSWRESLFTFVGAFSTLMMITRLNQFIGNQHDPADQLNLGTFGALVTMHYGLTSAPAGQPVNCMLGPFFSILIAFGIKQLTGMQLWMRQSLAASLAIFVQVKLGLTHPPSGAAAIAFVTSPSSWQRFGFMLGAIPIAIVSSALINNLNEKRQYPSYWGFQWAYKTGKHLVSYRLKSKQDDDEAACSLQKDGTFPNDSDE